MTMRGIRSFAVVIVCWVWSSCARAANEGPQPPVPPAEVVDEVRYGHLRAYVTDTTRSLDLMVLADLARALGADSGVQAFLARDTDSSNFLPGYRIQLDSAFDRLEAPIPGLGRRLGGWAADNLGQEYMVEFQLLVAKSKPGPESHDAQRLILPDGARLKYGPELAIYANKNIGGIDENDFKDSLAVLLGAVVDTTVNHPGYAPLRILPNRSYCLYLGQYQAQWRGYLATASATKQCAPSRAFRSFAEAPLAVYRDALPNQGFGKADLTESARWEWSDTKRINTIGIRCGADWCRVTPTVADGFTTADLEPTPFAEPGLSKEQKKLKRLKGWNDRQVLAEVDAGSVVPTGPTALLYPHVDLKALKQDGKFTAVAVVDLDRAPKAGGKYDRMGLGNGVNWVEFCGGTEAVCTTSARQDDPLAVLKDCTSKGNWHVRITSNPTGTPKRTYDCAVFTPETHGLPMPVRWAFDPADEGMWIRCPNGCCQVKG